MKRRNTKQAAPSKPDLAPAPIPEPEATTAFTPPAPDPVLPAAMPLTPYGKAMSLLTQLINHRADNEYSMPTPEFLKEYFLLSGEHMILTEDGWEPGSGKESYPDDGLSPELLDEVNAPGTERPGAEVEDSLPTAIDRLEARLGHAMAMHSRPSDAAPLSHAERIDDIISRLVI